MGEDNARTDSAARDDEERLSQAVSTAEQALIEFEIAVETFRVEVDNFARLHHQRLGPMYARLDELDALIAEAVAARTGDPEDILRAQQARAFVQPMPDVDELFGRAGGGPWAGRDPADPGLPDDAPLSSRVRPSREAQRLYRELARRAHPDLAQEDGEQRRRSAFIARVNEAYARGDEAALRQLAEEWDSGPEQPAAAPATENRLQTLYARLEWLAARRDALAARSSELEQSAMGAMLRLAPQDPDGLLNEIAEQLLAQVAEREARLGELLHPARD
ncbi:hypothetical protein AQ490_07790 [Wenjunlia vitaminophila]|uniref:J domain-containing protein n=1 Tax=Wenjunlia vitaminophila TaxID=76728 RepID=A0A0T6LMQ0_WENVI|nr:hypothetical protein [Wenjunlia vitaminophila]KRV47355.1 hypothetical protein AQ490_07790 [Wenjunlia vitaminophila]